MSIIAARQAIRAGMLVVFGGGVTLMSGAAQAEQLAESGWQATGTEGVLNLNQVAADRLAAHRQRRAAARDHEAETEARTRQHRDAVQHARRDAQRRGASLVRDAVAARYQQRESYREFLAAEAERAIATAQAEAEVAARSAHAVAEAQMALLEEYDRANRPEPGPREQLLAGQQAETRGELAHALADIVLGARELMAEPPLLTVTEADSARAAQVSSQASAAAVREVSTAGLTVRLFEDLPTSSPDAVRRPRRGSELVQDPQYSDAYAAEALDALEEEIDFRRDPAFAQVTPFELQSIPGNLIEFPRELIAPRRARPRLAEGPLRDEPQEPQLRIFEVDAEQPHLDAAQLEPGPMPEWQSLQLSGFEAEPASPAAASDAQTHLALPLHTASVERRLMSAAVDTCCVAVAWLSALGCVAEIAGASLRSLSLPMAAGAALVSFAVFAVGFQMLFFTFAESTPGMRYARISLCTFGEGNPSRRAMRQRVFSAVLAACPLGLGVAWMLLDNDGLGWHDRMSRMYQRPY